MAEQESQPVIEISEEIPIEEEEIIHVENENRPPALQDEEFFCDALTIEISLFLISLIAYGLVLIFQPEKMYAWIFLLAAGFAAAKAVALGVFAFARFEFTKRNVVYWLESLLYFISNVILYFGVYLYFNGRIPAGMLWIFLIPYFTLDMISEVIVSISKKLRIRRYAFFDGLQIVLIFMNVAHYHLKNWDWVLLYFLVFYFVLMLMTFVLVVWGVMLFRELMVRMRNMQRVNAHPILFTSSFYFITVWYCAMSFFFMRGVVRMMNAGLMDEDKRTAPLDPVCYRLAFAYVVLSVLSLVWLLVSRYNLQKFYRSIRNERVQTKFTLQKYRSLLTLNYDLVSETYFQKKDNSRPEDEEQKALVAQHQQLKKCFICEVKASDVLIRPCRHTGCCKDCMMDWMKAKRNCPVCRKPVTKIYVIEFDEKKQHFVSKSRIVLH